MFDNDDYGLNDKEFTKLEKWAGRFSYDLFASETNKRCVRFATRFAENASKIADINAFSLQWQKLGNIFAHPPPRIVIPVLRQMAENKAQGVLVLPLWNGSRFWPLLVPDGCHLANMVKKFSIFTTAMIVRENVTSGTFRRRIAYLAIKFNGERNCPWNVRLCKSNCLSYGCNA